MKNTYHAEEEMFDFVKQFENKTLPEEKWTHGAHLTVAAVYLTEHTPDEAICFLRSDIISFNLAKGGANTPARGYHETMTLFWVWFVMMYLVKNGRGRELVEVVNEMLADPMAGSGTPMRFYSKELITSVQARARWAEPDLKLLEFDAERNDEL